MIYKCLVEIVDGKYGPGSTKVYYGDSMEKYDTLADFLKDKMRDDECLIEFISERIDNGEIITCEYIYDYFNADQDVPCVVGEAETEEEFLRKNKVYTPDEIEEKYLDNKIYDFCTNRCYIGFDDVDDVLNYFSFKQNYYEPWPYCGQLYDESYDKDILNAIFSRGWEAIIKDNLEEEKSEEDVELEKLLFFQEY